MVYVYNQYGIKNSHEVKLYKNQLADVRLSFEARCISKQMDLWRDSVKYVEQVFRFLGDIPTGFPAIDNMPYDEKAELSSRLHTSDLMCNGVSRIKDALVNHVFHESHRQVINEHWKKKCFESSICVFDIAAWEEAFRLLVSAMVEQEVTESSKPWARAKLERTIFAKRGVKDSPHNKSKDKIRQTREWLQQQIQRAQKPNGSREIPTRKGGGKGKQAKNRSQPGHHPRKFGYYNDADEAPDDGTDVVAMPAEFTSLVG